MADFLHVFLLKLFFFAIDLFGVHCDIVLNLIYFNDSMDHNLITVTIT
jgi:hypothetical protein